MNSEQNTVIDVQPCVYPGDIMMTTERELKPKDQPRSGYTGTSDTACCAGFVYGDGCLPCDDDGRCCGIKCCSCDCNPCGNDGGNDAGSGCCDCECSCCDGCDCDCSCCDGVTDCCNGCGDSLGGCDCGGCDCGGCDCSGCDLGGCTIL